MEKIKKIIHKNDKYHIITKIKFDKYFISFSAGEKFYKTDLRTQSLKLANSDYKIKNNYQISPSGYGIHWEDIDEDLSIDGLIKSAEKLFHYRKFTSKKSVLKDKNKKKRHGKNL